MTAKGAANKPYTARSLVALRNYLVRSSKDGALKTRCNDLISEETEGREDDPLDANAAFAQAMGYERNPDSLYGMEAVRAMMDHFGPNLGKPGF